MRESLFKRLVGFLYALIIILLSALFFTNDFGLVDLRKSSVIIGLGMDFDEEKKLNVTAQLAVPMPAENGENTQFTVVTGKGETVARALNEINVRTGFYPKLIFCKLILIGESCKGIDLKNELNYFFNNEYTGLTPKIAVCKGSAGDLFSLQLPFGDSTTDSIERLLSEEAQKSANVTTVNLNEFGQKYFSKSQTAYMPYIQKIEEGGEEQSKSGGEESGGQEGQSGGQQSKSGESKPVQFDCGRTALFNRGVFCGVLEKEQAFAFNLINGEIRRAFVGFGDGEDAKTLGIKNCKGKASLEIENGVPVIKLSFSANAQLQDTREIGEKQSANPAVPQEVLRLAEDTIKKRMEDMVNYSNGLDCDLVGAKDLLYKYHFRYFETLKEAVPKKATFVYEIKLKSSG
ncbi:MAG: Ger(x)C family spore germination C-terminal domain-containing protein [Candidatus Coproplasma sp.]